MPLSCSRVCFAAFLVTSAWLQACTTVRDARPASQASAQARDSALRLPIPGLRDVACLDENCLALTANGLVVVPSFGAVPGLPSLGGADTLRTEGRTWILEAPTATGRSRQALTLTPPGLENLPPTVDVPVALDENPVDIGATIPTFTALMTHVREQGWRSGFYRTVVTAENAPITFARGVDNAGQLLRAGAPARFVRIGARSGPVSWPATLALHPTGTELYLVSWPDATVRAIDPMTLVTRWTVVLEQAAQPYFVDAGGRFLVVGEGPSDTERLVDWVPDALNDPFTVDPARDERIRQQDRPIVTTTVVIDLATHETLVRARGKLRRFLTLPSGRVVVATDSEVVFAFPKVLPS